MPPTLGAALRATLLPMLTIAILICRRWGQRGEEDSIPSIGIQRPSKETAFPRCDSEASQVSSRPGLGSPALVPAPPPQGLTVDQPHRQESSWEMRWANPEEYIREPTVGGLSASFCPVAVNHPTMPVRPTTSTALSNLSLVPGLSQAFTVSTTCSIIRHAIYSIRRDNLTPGSTLDCLVRSMEEWQADFSQQRSHLGHSSFWHRTSKKIVLSILALRLDDNLVFVRGCNLEVSLPSGSLCSERNAFGTALTMYPFLQREHFVGVAVLSLTEGQANLNPLPPCGVCSAWIDKIHEVNKEFRVVTFSDMSLQQLHITTLSPLATALQEIRMAETTEGPQDCQLSEAVQLTFRHSPTE
eukprot:GGOE01041131.1.p2 GENE.GGOE01041131.1~~GGOE01041131.1.p2  ORF type:complete len:356 (+),score=81.12 GGOE01041131.1:87-1154(+)